MLAETADESVIGQALAILESRLEHRDALQSPDCVKSFLRLQTQGLTHEVFACMFLDSAHRLIAYERMFRGTLTHAVVHPREVVSRALALNAAAVIAHHNHPSGCCRPSLKDEVMTSSLRSALALVEIALLDHVITSDADARSLAQMGLM